MIIQKGIQPATRMKHKSAANINVTQLTQGSGSCFIPQLNQQSTDIKRDRKSLETHFTDLLALLASKVNLLALLLRRRRLRGIGTGRRLLFLLFLHLQPLEVS
jgi:hypothetical protein